MIFTHCGKFGDVIQCLPILSAYYKKTKVKPILMLAKFPFAQQATELLEMQECVAWVEHIPYQPEHFGLGGQPYKFHLTNVNEQVIHLGFRSFPDKFFGQFIADEYNLEYDYDFILNVGEKRNKYRGKTVIIDRFEDNVLANNKIKGEYLPQSNSLVKNLQLAMGAGTIKTYNTAPAILLTMAGKNIVVYGPKHLKDINMNLVYNHIGGKVTWISL